MGLAPGDYGDGGGGKEDGCVFCDREGGVSGLRAFGRELEVLLEMLGDERMKERE